MKDFVWLVLQYHDYARMLVTDPGLRPGPENWKVIVPLVHWAHKMLVGTWATWPKLCESIVVFPGMEDSKPITNHAANRLYPKMPLPYCGHHLESHLGTIQLVNTQTKKQKKQNSWSQKRSLRILTHLPDRSPPCMPCGDRGAWDTEMISGWVSVLKVCRNGTESPKPWSANIKKCHKVYWVYCLRLRVMMFNPFTMQAAAVEPIKKVNWRVTLFPSTQKGEIERLHGWNAECCFCETEEQRRSVDPSLLNPSGEYLLARQLKDMPKRKNNPLR